MRSATLSAIAVSIALAGLSETAFAQSRTEPAGKLFFEGDLVRHRVDGQMGPWCVLQSRYKRGEAIAWRIRVLRPDGTVVDGEAVRSVMVELGSGETVPMDYGPHGDPPTDYFWASSWTVPASYPTGTLGYKVLVTMQDDSVVTWEPFTRAPSQLAIVEGEPMLETAAR
jgi:hypothetical protein